MRVSFIVPAYNASRWLPETLESVRVQALDDAEVIVIDDGSTDDTGVLIQSEWPEVKYHRTENRGVSHARNLGIELATRELLCFVDADDVLLPGKTQRQIELLCSARVTAVYGSWQRYENTASGKFQPCSTVCLRLEDYHADAATAFFAGFWCPTASYLYDAAFVKANVRFKEWLPVIQDARFPVDASLAGATWVQDAEIGVWYRQHQTGSVSTSNPMKFARDCMANAKDIARLWRSAGALGLDQRRILERSFGLVMSRAAGEDRQLFVEAAREMELLSPGFLPEQPMTLRWLSRLVGFPRATRLMSWWRGKEGRLRTI
jgi:glycosyltransferase involved in cell wall biosynthesis